jgi:LysM repeat protein
MSTPNPLIPQGTLQAKGARGTSNIRIAVATIIAIHVVFFGGLLLQGCKRDSKTLASQTNAPIETNAALTLPPMDTSSTSMYYTNGTQLLSEHSNATPPGATSTIPESTFAPAGSIANTTPDPWTQGAAAQGAGTQTSDAGTKDYTVARGDSFYKIAKANHITIAALQKANPNVDASKLKAGAKIKVPVQDASASAAFSPEAGTPSGAVAGSGEGKVYTVKPGDTLTKIARTHKVTTSSLRSANNMKTSRVNVGQKLKIPAKTETNGATAQKASAISTNTPF